VILKKLIDDHHRWTGSLRARHILDHWAESRARFIKVFPHEYSRALKQMNANVAADAAVNKAKAKTAAVPAK
jgi:glutamate synthase (NADPH/NADH) large chain